jgi:ABC-type transport system involved in cytochrome c biogenesis permease component
VMVGWLTWVLASDCVSDLPYCISEESQVGTLEQVCLAPIHLAGILTLRSLAYFLGVGAKGILAAVLLAFLRAREGR